MAGVDSYDILVVGSGESGKYLAWTMAGAGYRTAVIEQKLIGGSCPNIACIGAELADVALDSRAYIKVNERLETTAPGVWALGDCAGSPQFTHVAFDDFRIVRDNLKGGNRTTRNRLIPFCMFTDPELARVGLNESEARARHIADHVARMPMAAVLRTRAISEPRGFMKMLIDQGSDRILGFTVFGTEASELMSTVQTAMLGDQRSLEGPECARGTQVRRSPDTHDRDMPSGPDEQPTHVGAQESDIDQIFADSFPASDAPPWTLGVSAGATDERPRQKKARPRSAMRYQGEND